MGTIASLAVSLVAQTDKFERDIMRSSTVMKTFQMSAGNAAGKVVDLATAAAAAAAAGLAYLTKTSFETVDAMAKLAERLEVNFNTLRGMQFAADQAGVGAEEFGRSIEKMNTKLGEAIQGSAEAEKAFTNLGLSVDTLMGQGAEKAFKSVAAAISALPTSAERAAAAVDIFGKSGAQMMNFLRSNINESVERFAFLRGTLSNMDTSAIQNANDRVNELQQVFGGIGDTIAARVAPWIDKAGEAIIRWGFNAENIQPTINALADFMENRFTEINAIVERFGLVWETVKEPVQFVYEQLKKLYELHQMLAKPMQDAFAGLKNEILGIGGTSIESGGMGAFTKSAAVGFQKLKQDADNFELSLNRAFNRQMSDDAVGGLSGFTKSYTDAMRKAIEENEKFEQSLKKAADASSKAMSDWIQGLGENAKSPLEQFADEIKKLAEVMIKAPEQVLAAGGFDKLSGFLLDKYDSKMGKHEMNPGTFKQIDLSLMNLSGMQGPAKKQEVHAPEYAEMVKVLKDIKNQMGMGVATFAS